MAGGFDVLFALILALLAAAIVLAAAAVVGATSRTELLVAAGMAVAVACMLSVAMLWRQNRQWQAASRDLRNSEDHANELVESAMDAIVTVDEAQRVVTFNAAAEAVFRGRGTP